MAATWASGRLQFSRKDPRSELKRPACHCSGRTRSPLRGACVPMMMPSTLALHTDPSRTHQSSPVCTPLPEKDPSRMIASGGGVGVSVLWSPALGSMNSRAECGRPASITSGGYCRSYATRGSGQAWGEAIATVGLERKGFGERVCCATVCSTAELGCGRLERPELSRGTGECAELGLGRGERATSPSVRSPAVRRLPLK